MNKKHFTILVLLLVFLVCTFTANAIEQLDICLDSNKVLYIVQDECPKYGADYNQRVVDILTAQGFTVDAIGNANLNTVNWSEYAFMVIADIYFENPQDFPVNDFPAVILNTQNLADWDWTTSMSSFTMSIPPIVEVESPNHIIVDNLPQFIQVYTQPALPYYYLPRFERAPLIKSITTTYTPTYSYDDRDATVGIAEPGMSLLHGEVSNVRSCFFGANKINFWTDDAETLFAQCVAWVALGSDNDEDDIRDECDNCPAVYNPGQEDSDGDGLGDACDNCADVYNPNQSNIDQDELGDACDACQYDYGTWCNGCPEPVCDQCKEPFCPAEGIPYCANVEDGLVCNDELFCTVDDACLAGNCVGDPINIDDNISCTDDSCDEEQDTIIHTPVDSYCDNNLWCDGQEYCDAELDCQNGQAPVIDDGVSCTDDSCDEENDIIVNTPNDSYCDNSLWCDGFEYCDAQLDCQAGTAPDCSDNLFCTVNETCDEENDECVFENRDCSYNDLDEIDTCTNSPDDKDYTYDYAAGFTSVCDEVNDECTSSTYNYTHICDKDCGAECETDNDCNDTYCTLTSHKTYEYGVCDLDRCRCKGGGSYTCIVGSCGALCDEDTDCSCQEDHCDGKDWYDYPDYGYCGTSGAEGCLCQVGEEQGQPCEPTIYQNDPRCTECQVDDDCNKLDRDYCDEDNIMHIEGVCVNYECEEGIPSLTKDCNDDNEDYCNNSAIMHDDYTCYEAECVLDSTTLVYECDDGLYCDGIETCENANCVDAPDVNCSGNDIIGIDTCYNDPDNIDYTYDYRASFNSICVEITEGYECTTGDTTISHECSYDYCQAECDVTHLCEGDSCSETYVDYCNGNKLVEYDNNKIMDNTTVTDSCENSCLTDCTCTDCSVDCSEPVTSTYCVEGLCGAECDEDLDCEPKCIGNTYYYSGTCDLENDCGCDYETENCDDLDDWYNTSNKQWIDIDRCNEKEQQEQVYVNYSCSITGCIGLDGDTRWIDTGETRFKENGTSCDDGLYCTIDDACEAGSCSGTARDCSSYNDQCNIGMCDDEQDTCFAQPVNEGEACDDSLFCNVNETCQQGVCIGGTARDCSYNDLDEIDTCTNSPDDKDYTYDYAAGFTSICDEGLNICTESSYTYTHTCDKFECGAECDEQNPCEDKCIGNVYYYNGNCDLTDTCSCSYTTENCDDLDNRYNTSNKQWIEIDQCNEKEQQEQVYVNYSCSLTGCIGIDGETRWVDTGATRFKQDGTICNDKLFCTENDVCNQGICRGSPIDCSAYNIEPIAECDSQDDCNPMTWDYREAFISECVELAEGYECTQGDTTISHECSYDYCQAECDSTHLCLDTDCDFLDSCFNGKLYDCDDISNACLENCICEQNSCPSTYLECNFGGTDHDQDGWDAECGDCDDYNPGINPGEQEICDNFVDEDCDGYLNNGCTCEPYELCRTCVDNGFAEVTYRWNYDYCGSDYTEIVEDASCNCEYGEWQGGDCTAEGQRRQIKYETTSFDYCEDELYRTIEDQTCNCEYGEWQDENCISDGIRRQVRYETTQFEYCEDEIFRTVDDSICDCEASESGRICVDNGFAEVTYRWNYDYCGSDYTEIVEDASCNCEYTCWDDDECIMEGLMRQVRYEITSFEYCDDILYNLVADEVCECDYTEWQDDTCAAEGYMRQIRTENSGYEYCLDDLERIVEDASCNCEYTCWENLGCVADGKMRQTRDELSGFEYCNANLIREIDSSICNCKATELSRECVRNVTALVSYLWNYPYCGPDSEEVYDVNCWICAPDWKCNAYTECQQDGYQYCLNVYDIYSCGECYLGDYSEFTKECDYCAIHGPVIEAVDEITVTEEQLVTLNVEVSDPDDDTIIYSTSSPIGNDGEWQTQKGDEGKYNVVITATDGFCTSEKIVKLIVNEKPYQSLIVERTSYKEFVRPGDMQELYVTLENMGNIDLKEVKITALVDTLGIWRKTSKFNIKAGDEKTQLIQFEIPDDAEPGRYYMRIVISNDKIRRVLYRDFDVI